MKLRQDFDPEHYRRANQEYDQTWRSIDTVLYQLCREYPEHTSSGSVYAKVFIIGRTYQTGIERKVPSEQTQGSAMSKAAAHLLQRGPEIQALFKQLEAAKEPPTPSALENIAKVHGCLVKILAEIAANQQALRSFASKYMHFHNSAVPIFDDWANRALRGTVRRTRSLATFQKPEGADEQYVEYLSRFAELYRRGSALLPVTVRGLDVYLLSVANENAAKRKSTPLGASAILARSRLRGK